jgi:hypothetical protein
VPNQEANKMNFKSKFNRMRDEENYSSDIPDIQDDKLDFYSMGSLHDDELDFLRLKKMRSKSRFLAPDLRPGEFEPN